MNYTVVNQSDKNEVTMPNYQNTFESIDEKFLYISGLLSNDLELQEKVSTQIVGKMIMDNVEKNCKFSKIDVERKNEKFVRLQNGEHTKKIFEWY